MATPRSGGSSNAIQRRQKLTIRLPPDLYAATQQAVELGLAPNQNAFVEDSIRLRAREIRHERLRRLAEEAMADPGFVADMRGVMADFAHVDRENWPPLLSSEEPAKKKRARSTRK